MHSFATVPLSYLQGLVNFYVIALGSMLSIAVCEIFFFFFFFLEMKFIKKVKIF